MVEENPWGDWAQHASEKIKRADEEKQLNLKKQVQDNESIERAAPRLWEDTRREFRMAYDALVVNLEDGDRIIWRDVHANSVEIQSRDGACEINAKYDSKLRELTIDNSYYQPVLADKIGTVLWGGRGGGHGVKRTTREIVRESMNSFVDCINRK